LEHHGVLLRLKTNDQRVRRIGVHTLKLVPEPVKHLLELRLAVLNRHNVRGVLKPNCGGCLFHQVLCCFVYLYDTHLDPVTLAINPYAAEALTDLGYRRASKFRSISLPAQSTLRFLEGDPSLGRIVCGFRVVCDHWLHPVRKRHGGDQCDHD
jgi:hypothetical protein